MNIYDVIKARYQDKEITVEDIERYVRENMITQDEADQILKLKENANEYKGGGVNDQGASGK